jgi:hypothetical protein
MVGLTAKSLEVGFATLSDTAATICLEFRDAQFCFISNMLLMNSQRFCILTAEFKPACGFGGGLILYRQLQDLLAAVVAVQQHLKVVPGNLPGNPLLHP